MDVLVMCEAGMDVLVMCEAGMDVLVMCEAGMDVLVMCEAGMDVLVMCEAGMDVLVMCEAGMDVDMLVIHCSMETECCGVSCCKMESIVISVWVISLAAMCRHRDFTACQYVKECMWKFNPG